MLASLLRPRKGRRARRPEPSPFSSPLLQRHDGQNPDRDYFRNDHGSQDEDDYDGGGEDEDDDNDPILPIFSAEHLDRLPIYSMTHSIRLLVLQRCETTLSWDQLRSPQVSQFLVKPIQQEIRATLFNRGTLYALVANCLQFQKQGQLNPGNVGVEKTRGLICELLAMRLLKEYSTRELIDALSYDFDPLQGLTPPAAITSRSTQPRLARISTVEIAIRAQAKKFLAHPLVVQQLEAIWSGTIVFHSYADSLHRPMAKRAFQRGPNYGTMENGSHSPGKISESASLPASMVRRTVTLYDPREASIFKLSRLRVPRYRQLFSTCSFAVMLGLFLAVLVSKSVDITALEMLFWLWSAGYLLDEVEQGFNLYIQSVWNAFDLGILLCFVIYYVLRLYGILMPDVRKYHVAEMAYDVLASTAVLLFPRLFSVLDHYRYFSQLLIAFRMMALDLMAILILIIISCSGFFVAFTLAFGDRGLTSAGSAAYALFQMLMGFTPAAWDIWSSYNPLGKAILVLFLFIAHFLIVTILITVLTNSFMAVVQNANEEHQFLFAVNTISMVKSDALFSYIAPTNIVAWLLTPLRFIMSFRSFVKMNRLLIKATHFPILFAIFTYERLILSRIAFQPEELVEQRGRSRSKAVPVAFSIRGTGDLFSPGTRLREPSITTYHKDRALDEVFRRPFRGPTPPVRQNGSDPVEERRKSSNVVRDWMQGMGHEGGASPPLEEPRSVLERLENARRPGMRRAKTSRMAVTRRMQPPVARSVASDPDVTPTNVTMSQVARGFEEPSLMSLDEQPQQQTDADGDDELITNDDNEDDRLTLGQSVRTTPRPGSDKENQPIYESSTGEDYFRTPMATKSDTPIVPSSVSSRIHDPPPLPKPSNLGQNRRHHNRNVSTNTILFSPQRDGFGSDHESTSTSPVKRPPTAHHSGAATPKRPTTAGKRPTATRPNLSPRNKSSSNILGIGFGNLPRPPRTHRDPSFNALALDLASDLGDNRPRPELPGMPGLSASFSTQMEMAAMGARRFARRSRDSQDHDEDEEQEDRSRTNRILLARMNTLEESFKEVLKEVRGLRQPADKKGKGKKGTKTPATAGSRTPGASSAGAGSAGTAIHDSDFDRSSIRRIDEERDTDVDTSRSSV
ncbi:Calcium channel YVC1 [Botryosphaeria dothidea]|uniref:Calcium channel YVC1 n=1 Tax=Botryosphaeria dothidea TaxID=55169 RepID=A0A8H4IW50_9PEZI|nr:Calcium channel YVC1 [Botryosphaeria dothidea]